LNHGLLKNAADIVNRDAVTTSLGDMNAGTRPLFEPLGIVTEGKTEIDYLIDFWALNGSWVEEMHYKRLNGTLEYANRVLWEDFPADGNVDHVVERVVFEEVSKGYPRIDGKVEWTHPIKRR
jgi:hypothetical protein